MVQLQTIRSKLEQYLRYMVTSTKNTEPIPTSNSEKKR